MAALQQIIAGNWKMNLTLSQGCEFLNKLQSVLNKRKPLRKIILAPNFTLLSTLAGKCSACGVELAAQNCAPQASGAFTGETSVPMLKDVGAAYVLVGHSERRQLFAESDQLLALKLKAVVTGGLMPILCVGETLVQREQGDAVAVVTRQLTESLIDFPGSKLLVAYEPVWAIGTGKTATPEDARLMHGEIRKFLQERFAWGSAIPVLYGGSAKPGNAAELLAQPEVNGLLVGGAALDPDSFMQIVKA